MQSLSQGHFSLPLSRLMSIDSSTNMLGVVKRLAVIYLLAHGGIFLLLNAVYWDDWILFKAGDGVITKMFHDSNPFLDFSSPMHIALMELGPWAYRSLSFLMMFFSGLFLWGILSPVGFLGRQEKFEIVVLFLVLPLYAARVALIVFPGVFCYFVFFLGWWLLAKIENPGFRVIVLGLFFLSFRNNSLLVFYALPVAYLYYLENGLTLSKCFSWALRRLDLLVLPIAFFIIKAMYFPPTGIYAGYNEIHAVNLKYWLVRMIPLPVMGLIFLAIRSWTQNGVMRNKKIFRYWEMVEFVLVVLGFSILFQGVAPTLLWLCFLGLGCYHYSRVGRVMTREVGLVFLGLIVLYLGVFPYLLVEKTPRFYDWDSRFQLLAPLGVSIVLSGCIKMLGDNFKLAMILLISGSAAFLCPGLLKGQLVLLLDWKPLIHLLMPLLIAIIATTIIYALSNSPKLIALLVVGSVLINSLIYVEYAIDWQKQRYVISKIAASEQAKQTNTIIVDDQTSLLNARIRDIRFYEYTGWLKEAFGDESRLGFSLLQVQPGVGIPELLPKLYNIADQSYMTSSYKKGTGVILLMTIRYGKVSNLFSDPLDVSFKPFSI